MGYSATNIATVPIISGEGEHYNWFVFFLPGPFENQIRTEVLNNFFRLSEQVGTENLFVTGADVDHFHSQVLLRYAMYLKGFDENNIPLPALMITDTAPSEVEIEAGEINAQIMYFPLADTYLKEGMLSNFLRQVCTTLQDAESFEDLENMQQDKLDKKWGWVTRYFDLKPNFMGFGINLNAVIEDIAKRDA